MDLTVFPDRGEWRARLDDGRVWPCVIGRGGVTAAKREGDGATPLGRWPVRRVLYRPDRLPHPETRLPVAPIAPDDGWCDDPASPAYNQPVQRPCESSHEALWRDDDLYDLLAVLGVNDDPPIPGRGSAIFLHCAPADGTATAGCVALERTALDTVLRVMAPGSYVAVTAA